MAPFQFTGTQKLIKGPIAPISTPMGIEGLTMPDPIGTNGQGTDDDGNIAYQATQWLSAQKKSASPFCLDRKFREPTR